MTPDQEEQYIKEMERKLREDEEARDVELLRMLLRLDKRLDEIEILLKDSFIERDDRN